MTWHSKREMSCHAMEGYASYMLVETFAMKQLLKLLLYYIALHTLIVVRLTRSLLVVIWTKQNYLKNV